MLSFKKIYKIFTSLCLAYLLSFVLVSIIMRNSEKFLFEYSDFVSVLFLNFNKFEYYSLSKINFSLYFIYIIPWMLLINIYNKNFCDVNNYYIFILNKYQKYSKFIKTIILKLLSKTFVYFMIDILSFSVIATFFSVDTITNYGEFKYLVVYLFSRHILLFYLSIYFYLSTLTKTFNSKFTVVIILIVLLVSCESFIPIKCFTYSFVLQPINMLLVSVLFCFLLIPLMIIMYQTKKIKSV